jgi:hypothetical protein
MDIRDDNTDKVDPYYSIETTLVLQKITQLRSNKKTFRYPKAVFSNKKLLLNELPTIFMFYQLGYYQIFLKKTGVNNRH